MWRKTTAIDEAEYCNWTNAVHYRATWVGRNARILVSEEVLHKPTVAVDLRVCTVGRAAAVEENKKTPWPLRRDVRAGMRGNLVYKYITHLPIYI